MEIIYINSIWVFCIIFIFSGLAVYFIKMFICRLCSKVYKFIMNSIYLEDSDEDYIDDDIKIILDEVVRRHIIMSDPNFSKSGDPRDTDIWKHHFIKYMQDHEAQTIDWFFMDMDYDYDYDPFDSKYDFYIRRIYNKEFIIDRCTKIPYIENKHFTTDHLIDKICVLLNLIFKHHMYDKNSLHIIQNVALDLYNYTFIFWDDGILTKRQLDSIRTVCRSLIGTSLKM